jgi:hypothetical protein
MPDPLSFSAQCPICQNELRQGPFDPDAMRILLREDQLIFYCSLCDHKWKASDQEEANVESMLSCPVTSSRGGHRGDGPKS